MSNSQETAEAIGVKALIWLAGNALAGRAAVSTGPA